MWYLSKIFRKMQYWINICKFKFIKYFLNWQVGIDSSFCIKMHERSTYQIIFTQYTNF